MGLVKRFGASAVFIAAALLPFLAVAAGKEKPRNEPFMYFMTFSADGEDFTVPAELVRAPAMLHGTTGGIYNRLTPADVHAMEAALASDEAQSFFARHNMDPDLALAQQIFGTALAKPVLSEETPGGSGACPLTIDIATKSGSVYAQVQIQLMDSMPLYAIDDAGSAPVRRVRFSARDAAAVMKAMRDAGFADRTADILVGSVRVAPGSSPETSFSALSFFEIKTEEPTNPGCGECESGNQCRDGKNCCLNAKGAACMHCRFCG